MDIEGVMVSYDYSGPEGQANIITVAASGIKFSDRWVLTHGSILSPLKIAKDIFKAKGKIIHNDQIYDTLPEIYITCERPKLLETRDSELDEYYDELEDTGRRRSDEKNRSVTHGSYQVRVMTGRIRHMWQCSMLDQCVNDILYSWTIGHRDGDIEKQSELGKVLLSVLILVDLTPEVKESGPIRPLSALLDAVGVPPGRGAIMHLHTTPFGCEVFLNSLTTGTVCGLVGRQPYLLLTDAATALGSEGGPAFITVNGKSILVGIVVCSVSWWRGEWVGLTLIAPLASVLSTKLRIADKFAPTAGLTVETSLADSILREIDANVVLVRCGSMWGSGIYLGDGYFVTCSHVVCRHEPTKVSIFCGGEQQVGIVKYRTPRQKAYDLALIYSNPEYWTKLVKCTFAMPPAVKGETVIAIGYPYFNEQNFKSLKPTITRGQVNNISPSMLQTSCCVQSGFSGGPICRLTRTSRTSKVTCEVLGVIVCNAKTQKSACYPYINMAVPVRAFRNVLMQYIKAKDKETLNMIENKQDYIQSQWRLQPYRSKI